jgi:hypothetical protein
VNFPVKSSDFESGEDIRSNVTIVLYWKDLRKIISNSVLRRGVDVAMLVQTLSDLRSFKLRNLKRTQF